MELNDDSLRKNIFDQKQNEQKEDSLSVELVEEFKSYQDALSKKIEETYGRVRLQERLNVEKFKTNISEIDKCIAEGFLKVSNNKTRKYIHIKKIKFSNEKSGEDALSSLKVEMNDRLKVPWLRRINLFDFPFHVAFRESNNKKCIEMTHTFRNFKYTADLKLVIREIII